VYAEPELGLPLGCEPILGHGFPLGEPDFCVGLGVVGLAGVVGVVGVVGVAGVLDCVFVVLVAVVAAPALVMPAAAPPVASAPATMVAPSSLEMVIGSNLLGSIWGWGVPTIVRDVAKRRSRGV
jgi:hypothetical protein